MSDITPLTTSQYDFVSVTKSQYDFVSGTLELTSKVRYGMTSRGIPLFRFIPYNRAIGPFAVGCSQRNLFYNVHAIVEPTPSPSGGFAPGSPSASPYTALLPKATLVQNLGVPTPETNLEILLTNYAYDCKKEMRPKKKGSLVTEQEPLDFDSSNRTHMEGFTFHIDPPGCKDVDDSFTFLPLSEKSNSWQISINIADVAAWVKEGSELDLMAAKRATSFYSPTGEALAPMFPPLISEGCASLGGPGLKPTLSLQFTWTPGSEPAGFQWIEATTRTDASYTYDEADILLHKPNTAIRALQQLSAELDQTNTAQTSHEWVQNMMILYNRKAGEALKEKGNGILRMHSAPDASKLAEYVAIHPDLAFLAYDAATFCLATDENTSHFGLGTGSYAYASSPIRRYCDLVNQRILKAQSAHLTQTDKALVDSLNRRQKQAKAFSRDLFFMTELSSSSSAGNKGKAGDKGNAVEGTVVECSTPEKYKVYVPAWKRCVKVKSLVAEDSLTTGSKVSLEWFCDYQQPNWKERIIFRKK